MLHPVSEFGNIFPISGSLLGPGSNKARCDHITQVILPGCLLASDLWLLTFDLGNVKHISHFRPSLKSRKLAGILFGV
jgi:hypothetical protein